MRVPGFLGGSNETQAVTADSERTINWYPEPPIGGGRPQLCPVPGVKDIGQKWTLYNTPTIVVKLTGYDPARAHFYDNGREFAVLRNELWEIDANAGMISRGTVSSGEPSSGKAFLVSSAGGAPYPATISSNGDGGGELFITSGGNGYIYNLSTNVLTEVSALSGLADFGAFLDGYFLALDTGTSTLYTSALFDGTSWTTGTDFAQRSIASDPWLALKVVDRYAWLIGEKTSEAWYNAGTTFPLALHPSSFVRLGTSAPWSVATTEDSVFWLSGSAIGGGQVVQARGFTPKIVSTPAMHTQISKFERVDDAWAWTYSDMGHTFYVLNFPSGGTTWVYDVLTQQWHERATWDTETGKWKPWAPGFGVRAFGEIRVLNTQGGLPSGTSFSNALYRLDSDFATDVNGNGMRRLRRAPVMTNENKRLFYNFFELDMDPGEGLVSGQGSDPQVMLRWSDDGGRTWSHEHWRGAGKIGEYHHRVRWDRLGAARKRVFEVSVSDPIPWRLTDAYADVEPSEY